MKGIVSFIVFIVWQKKHSWWCLQRADAPQSVNLAQFHEVTFQNEIIITLKTIKIM